MDSWRSWRLWSSASRTFWVPRGSRARNKRGVWSENMRGLDVVKCESSRGEAVFFFFFIFFVCCAGDSVFKWSWGCLLVFWMGASGRWGTCIVAICNYGIFEYKPWNEYVFVWIVALPKELQPLGGALHMAKCSCSDFVGLVACTMWLNDHQWCQCILGIVC